MEETDIKPEEELQQVRAGTVQSRVKPKVEVKSTPFLLFEFSRIPRVPSFDEFKNYVFK